MDGLEAEGSFADLVVVEDAAVEEHEDELHRLLRLGHRYGFFQAIRLVEQSYPDAAPVGGLGPVEKEVLRLRPRLSLAYPSADIHELRIDPGVRIAEEPCLQLVCHFLGIYGASSPLPTFVTERLLDDEEEAPLTRRVLDLLNHRIYGLLYRIWRKYRPASEPTAVPDAGFARCLGLLLGLDLAQVGRGTDVDPAWFLGFADIIGQRPLSVAALESALRRLLPDDPLEVRPCVASWSPIPPDQRARLGEANCLLGGDLFLGDLVPERSTTFAVAIMAVPYERFLRLLPGGDLHRSLRALVELLVTDHLDCEVQVTTAADSVPPVRLGASHYGLGWNTRLFRNQIASGHSHTVTYRMHEVCHG